jgi:hypothetical protein
MKLLLNVTPNSIGDLDVLADNLISHWLCSSGGSVTPYNFILAILLKS